MIEVLAGGPARLLMLARASGALLGLDARQSLTGHCHFAALFVATTWFLTSSRLVSQPDWLTRIGVGGVHPDALVGWAPSSVAALLSWGYPVVAGVSHIDVIAMPVVGSAVIVCISALCERVVILRATASGHPVVEDKVDGGDEGFEAARWKFSRTE